MRVCQNELSYQIVILNEVKNLEDINKSPLRRG